MGLFNKKPLGGGILDVIRCDLPSYLIWKWHPEGTEEGNNRKENSIRWGSRLRVKEGSVAVFVYKQKNGTIQDYIEGPFDETIKTANLPFISNVVESIYGGNSPFPAEIYFINLAHLIQQKFAVPYFDIFDPRFADFGVPVAVRGSVNFKITDYKQFIKLHRLETFSMDDFNIQVRDAITRYVKDSVANAPNIYQIPAIQLEKEVEKISSEVEKNLKTRLYNDFGVTVTGVDIGALDTDKTSEGYQNLMKVTRDLVQQTMQAKTEVEIKEMQDTQKLGVLQRKASIEEEMYALHKQTQSANLAAFQAEAAEHVGVASAEGLGKMGEGGGANVGGGFNAATIMSGIALGGAIGQNLAGSINNVMNPNAIQASVTPPPIPNETYYIAENAKPTGPYQIGLLKNMIITGKVTKDTLLWKAGMENWVKAEEIDDLKGSFSITPPPIPKE